MEPIKRKMMMKNVAGFHSLERGFFSRGTSDRRSGFGIRDFQKEVSTTVDAKRMACVGLVDATAGNKVAPRDSLRSVLDAEIPLILPV